MSSSAEFVEYVTENMCGAGTISARKMFGEYGVYCDGKIVALICNNQLFIKPTDAGRGKIPQAECAFPYPGAKPYLLIGGDIIDDVERLSELVRVTADALPLPKRRRLK
ncbi:MAG: TfoX/Sxy family protein [Chitinispirillaceae bacterium]|nr:TfoX/Sxy family protein [Chitinispirillaceae bacterium]